MTALVTMHLPFHYNQCQTLHLFMRCFCVHICLYQPVLFFQTFMYNDMYFYNIKSGEWTLLKVPVAPPPRCAHQVIKFITL